MVLKRQGKCFGAWHTVHLRACFFCVIRDFFGFLKIWKLRTKKKKNKG